MDLELRFTDKEITAWGGMGLMKRMLELDSTVMTCYGRQEGAARDYNSRKPGRYS